jgi:hypothetical protein
MVLNRNPVAEANGDTATARPEGASAAETLTKKQFIEPAISVPADVLEATAFFQAPTSASGDTDGLDP